MEFSCSNCEYKSKQKQHIKTHIQRNSNCSEAFIKKTMSTISCEFCFKEYTLDSSLKRHLKTCKEKPKSDVVVQESTGKEIIDGIVNNNPESKYTINNTINNITNVNININLVPWYDPAIPQNINDYYLDSIKRVFLSVPRLIELIHFNKDLPENHTLTITNARNKLAKVYDGNEWRTMDEDKLINRLINDFETMLEDYATDSDNHKELQYLQDYKDIKERFGEEVIYSDLKKEVKRLIYDKRDMVQIKY